MAASAAHFWRNTAEFSSESSGWGVAGSSGVGGAASSRKFGS
jgi:hypothetical protein